MPDFCSLVVFFLSGRVFAGRVWGVHTKLAVAVVLSLVLLLPALAQAEGIVCQVWLCWKENKTRGRMGLLWVMIEWVERRESMASPPHSVPRTRVSLPNPSTFLGLFGGSSKVEKERKWCEWWDRVFRPLRAVFHCDLHQGGQRPDLNEVVVISGCRCWLPRSRRVWLALDVNSTGTLHYPYFWGSPKQMSCF